MTPGTYLLGQQHARCAPASSQVGPARSTVPDSSRCSGCCCCRQCVHHYQTVRKFAQWPYDARTGMQTCRHCNPRASEPRPPPIAAATPVTDTFGRRCRSGVSHASSVHPRRPLCAACREAACQHSLHAGQGQTCHMHWLRNGTALTCQPAASCAGCLQARTGRGTPCAGCRARAVAAR